MKKVFRCDFYRNHKVFKHICKIKYIPLEILCIEISMQFVAKF